MAKSKQRSAGGRGGLGRRDPSRARSAPPPAVREVDPYDFARAWAATPDQIRFGVVGRALREVRKGSEAGDFRDKPASPS